MTTELFPPSMVSANPFKNAKGVHKTMIRVDSQLLERILIERDPEEIARFLNTLEAQAMEVVR